jgi:hypothetical protein
MLCLSASLNRKEPMPRPTKTEIAAEIRAAGDEITDRICEALRAEYGKWTPEVGLEALELRLLAMDMAAA